MVFIKKHGLSRTKIYKVWKSMRSKCYSSNEDNRHKKGDIWICDEWKDDPVAFVDWSKLNGYKEGLQLVRKNKEDGYHPGNCAFLKIEEASKTHGMRRTRLYNTWTQIKQRCTNEKNDRYAEYGGRGISVCVEWLDSFEVFKEWALKNGYNKDLSIDRIDVDGNYTPDNCRWSTNLEQSRNKRDSIIVTIKGVTKSLPEWSEDSNIPYKTLQARYYKGLRGEKLLAPMGYHNELLEINDVSKTANAWANEAGLPLSTIKRRYKRGVRGEDLLRKGRLRNS
ncbi:hypothetical protein QTG56_25435 (plasmid) [Rossellomorea sp. AcN35-11]|nr:hypothetical protein [Rossellomorea aquimaris]WJV31959.1 hypothetical protein QTG56_25435 [Rossellomorea sp. AcN35-11]